MSAIHELKRFAKLLLDAGLLIVAVVAVLSVGEQVRRRLFSPTPAAPVTVGKKLPLKRVRFDSGDYTIVLAASPQCSYCAANNRFYEELYGAAQQVAVQFVLVVRDSVDSNGYRSSLGMHKANVQPVDFRSVGIAVTPTLLLVDRAGIVKQVWVGALGPDEQESILAAVRAAKLASLETMPVAERPALAIGDRLELRTVHFEAADRTIVLALSPICRYSIQSRHFHEALYLSAQERGVPLVLVVPSFVDPETVRTSLGMHKATARAVDFRSVGIPATPAVLVVDRVGAVRQMWLGSLGRTQQDAILASPASALLDGRVTVPVRAEVSHAGLAKVRDDPFSLILDVRAPPDYGRDHLPGAVNIPYGELEVRATKEIPRSKTVIVDCSHFISSGCDRVAALLESRGVGSVLLLNKGAFATAGCRR